MAIRITAAQFPAALRKRLAQDTAVVRAAAIEVTARGVAEAVAETDRQQLVDQAQFRLSWKFRPLKNGSELRNDAPYAGVIEYGRRPGRPGPPFQPIFEWVVRKLVGTGEVERDDAKSVAWAIRNTIHKRGSKPRFVLRVVVKKMGPWFKEAAIRQLRRKAHVR